MCYISSEIRHLYSYLILYQILEDNFCKGHGHHNMMYNMLHIE